MALILKNLDEQTRKAMLEEVDYDTKNGLLYFSPRLSDFGRNEYPQLLVKSISDGNDSTLAESLRHGCFNSTETRKKPKGGTTQAKIPSTAPDTLAEGEFNRFYIRALCRIVIDTGKGQLKVCRVRHSANPRPESEMKIGQVVDAALLLEDIKNNIGIDTFLGIPAGPNSGLGVELVDMN